jgi:hypothetical protein
MTGKEFSFFASGKRNCVLGYGRAEKVERFSLLRKRKKVVGERHQLVGGRH